MSSVPCLRIAAFWGNSASNPHVWDQNAKCRTRGTEHINGKCKMLKESVLLCKEFFLQVFQRFPHCRKGLQGKGEDDSSCMGQRFLCDSGSDSGDKWNKTRCPLVKSGRLGRRRRISQAFGTTRIIHVI